MLGHKISQMGLEFYKAKIEVIEKVPPTIFVKGIRSFLGHASLANIYYGILKYCISSIQTPGEGI